MADDKWVATLRLPKDLRDRVVAAAEAEDRSINNYLARVIDLNVPARTEFQDELPRAEAS